jgi:hypothetical protein
MDINITFKNIILSIFFKPLLTIINLVDIEQILTLLSMNNSIQSAIDSINTKCKYIADILNKLENINHYAINTIIITGIMLVVMKLKVSVNIGFL